MVLKVFPVDLVNDREVAYVLKRLKLIKDKGSILDCSKEIIYEQSFKIKTLEHA